jgi:hypothetical protein
MRDYTFKISFSTQIEGSIKIRRTIMNFFLLLNENLPNKKY